MKELLGCISVVVCRHDCVCCPITSAGVNYSDDGDVRRQLSPITYLHLLEYRLEMKHFHAVAPLLHPSVHPLSRYGGCPPALSPVCDSKWCFDVASPLCAGAFRNSPPLLPFVLLQEMSSLLSVFMSVFERNKHSAVLKSDHSLWSGAVIYDWF